MIGYDLYKRWKELPKSQQDQAIQFFAGYGLSPIDGFKEGSSNPDKEHAKYSAECFLKSIEYAEKIYDSCLIRNRQPVFMKTILGRYTHESSCVENVERGRAVPMKITDADLEIAEHRLLTMQSIIARHRLPRAYVNSNAKSLWPKEAMEEYTEQPYGDGYEYLD